MNDKELYKQILGIVSPWEITKINLGIEKLQVDIYIEYLSVKEAPCPKCGKLCKIHDRRKERNWRHLDTCQLQTIIHCKTPRIICDEHKTSTIDVPWAAQMSRFTKYFERIAIDILHATKNRKKAAELLRLSWDETNGIMQRAVKRGMERRTQDNISYVGIDEKSFLKGHKYASIMTDIQGKRVLEVVENRDTEAVESLWKTLSGKQIEGLKAISMDFWQAYINGAKTHAPNADIVHDKFHIMKYMNEAVDAVRKNEHRSLMSKNDTSLKGHKYLFLKNKKDFTKENIKDFRELNINQLAVGRAWNRRELLRELWNYSYEKPARTFFNKWYYSATHSQLKPIIKVAKMLKKFIENILTYLKHRITNGFAEGMNSVIQHIKSTARGFRNFGNYRIAILFFCGKLNLYPQ